MPITNSGYGVGEQGKFCTEDSPLRPVSLYGVTKVEAEKLMLERENSDQPAARHGVRHVAAHAHRSIGEQFRLSRGQ